MSAIGMGGSPNQELAGRTDDPELALTMQLPAQYADRYYLSANADRVRITFGEQGGLSRPRFFTSIALSLATAEQMIEMLQFVVEAARKSEAQDGG